MNNFFTMFLLLKLVDIEIRKDKELASSKMLRLDKIRTQLARSLT